MVIDHNEETHRTWYLTRAKTTVKWKSFTYDVTVADMNGLNRYLYVYNAPSIGMNGKGGRRMICELCDDPSIVWLPHCLCKEEEQ